MPTDRRVFAFVSVMLTALLVGCAPAPAANPGNAPQDRDVISAQELGDARVASGSVLEAVRKLRPRFLNGLGTPAIGQVDPSTARAAPAVMASINGASPIDLAELGRMSASEVSEVRYLSVADAGFRFGLSGNNTPVLLVTVKPR